MSKIKLYFEGCSFDSNPKWHGIANWIFTIVGIAIATWSLVVGLDSMRFSMEATKPQLSIQNRSGVAPRLNPFSHKIGQSSILCSIPLLNLKYINSGGRPASKVMIKYEVISELNKCKFVRDSIELRNPVGVQDQRNLSIFPVVPNGDLAGFYLRVKFDWFDDVLECKDSLKVEYYCYQGGDENYYLVGPDEESAGEFLNKAKDYTVFKYDNSVRDRIKKFYSPKVFCK